MAKTSFERFEAGAPGTTGFKISGSLGFHENAKVEQLVAECLKRGFERVIFDFSALESLGGGVARILRGFVKQMETEGKCAAFVITSDVILEFLRDGKTPIVACATVDEALGARSGASRADDAGLEKQPSVTAGAEGGADLGVIHMSYESGDAPRADGQPAGGTADEIQVLGNMLEPGPVDLDSAERAEDDAGGAVDGAPGNTSGVDDDRAGEDESVAAEMRKSAAADDSAAGSELQAAESGTPAGEEIILEIFGQSEDERAGRRNERDLATPPQGVQGEAAEAAELNRRLKRRILELRTLFSISSDFNAIRDRKRLLDIFLLTSIAQGGVESAVFLEKKGDLYEPVMSKGIESGALRPIRLAPAEETGIQGSAEVIEIDLVPLAGETRAALKQGGLVYLCPFHRGEGPASIVMLGKRIAGRGMQKEDFEFMQVLVNLARGAYRNAVLFEREHERTLGIVKTLISLIEENTLLKGTSEFVSRYVGMVAKDMDYPDERFTELIYGTVLRDMGMIKVSDLIVRSPRDLNKDEWQVIKRHPEDGAEMLRRMKFSEHVIDIVLSHHERFNGEGYPRGLRGRDIPLGARIISVVESYAAMIHERPNRPALAEREALDTLRENYGLRYDCDVANHFCAIMEKEIAKSVKPVAAAV